MGNRKRKHREPLFWLEAAFIVLLLAGAYVIGSYARAKQSDSLQEVFVADHGTNVVEVTDAQGTITGSEVVDYDELISDYRNILLVGVDARDQKRIDRGANADIRLFAPPPQIFVRLMSIPSDFATSKESLSANATPSKTACVISALVVSIVMPINVPLAFGLLCGERSPIRYGKKYTWFSPSFVISACSFANSFV